MSKSQKPKVYTGRNQAFNNAMMEKGRSSAVSRHRSVKDYRRKPKHRARGWE